MTAQITSQATTTEQAERSAEPDFDVVVVGAGFAGLYLLHRLRRMGFSAMAFEAGDDVGGTWYWNRYPGARCDVQTVDYSYSFDPELEIEWQWSERYATQPEILRYLRHVADKHDVRRDIQFSTLVESATWDADNSFWRVRAGEGEEVTCRFYVMATGCLSVPKTPDIAGADRFAGEVYSTSSWPHGGVDFAGKRVAVIGTGSSGIQSIPLIAEQAEHLTVFQRTPNFSIPARNGAVSPRKLAELANDRTGYREAARWSRGGIPGPQATDGALQVSEQERLERYETMWAAGELFGIAGAFNDLLINAEANETLCEFVRNKIRETVNNPATAELLCPTNHHIGTKRPCLDTNYYETYNLPHVRLIDLRSDPITTITENGIDTASEHLEFDAVVFATGFDAMTGAIVAVDIAGRDATLSDKWSGGPETYLGLMTAGFPNFFTITGPGSPSVMSNMAVSIEQHVDWVTDCIDHLRRNQFETIEPTDTAEAGWVSHVNDLANITLFPSADSWYMGANVPGKPRVFLPYIGGVDGYRKVCDEVVQQEYLGFNLCGLAKSQCNDGVIRRLQPDVAMVLDFIETLGLPALEGMTVEEAREFSVTTAAARPPGPDVGEIVDGVLPGADGELEYRLYRPTTPGPHPIVAYFHGGGWVIGSHESDDPFCRDLCRRSDAIIVSVNYRHAPEHRFPAAPDDGFAAVQWIAENAADLGGIPGQLAIAGWSAGGNIAAVVSQTARDAGGPAIAGQLLLCPATDSDLSRQSHTDNAEGFVLTTATMEWFWDLYADPSDRVDPRAAPIRAADLSNLPPALVITCEFDPLRDEGTAYAEAMEGAGVTVQHLPCHGHIHTSLTAVDVILSGAPVREEMAAALREFFTT